MRVTKEAAYEVLGVSADSSESEIKSAYKKLALKWHPDKAGSSSGAEDKMKEINAAFARLTRGDDTSDEEDWDDVFEAQFGGVPMTPDIFMFFMAEMWGHRGGGRARKGPSYGPAFRRGFSTGYSYYDDDDDDDDDDYYEYFAHSSSSRKHKPRRNEYEYTWAENADEDEKLERHRQQEAARMAEMQKKAEVLKVLGQLPRPIKKDITETTMTITIDRSGKFSDKQLPDGGVWELYLRKATGPPSETQWKRLGGLLVKKTVKMSDLSPGTQYVLKARGGFQAQDGEITWCNFSVEATYRTLGAAAPSAPTAASSGSTKQRRKRQEKERQQKECQDNGRQQKECQEEERQVEESLESQFQQNERLERERQDVQHKEHEEDAPAAAPTANGSQKQRRKKQEKRQGKDSAPTAEPVIDEEELKRQQARDEAIQRQLEKEAAEYEQLKEKLGQEKEVPGNPANAQAAAKRKKKRKAKKAGDDSLPEANRDNGEEEHSSARVPMPPPIPTAPPTHLDPHAQRRQQEAARRDALLAAQEEAMLREAIERSKLETTYVPPEVLAAIEKDNRPVLPEPAPTNAPVKKNASSHVAGNSDNVKRIWEPPRSSLPPQANLGINTAAPLGSLNKQPPQAHVAKRFVNKGDSPQRIPVSAPPTRTMPDVQMPVPQARVPPTPAPGQATSPAPAPAPAASRFPNPQGPLSKLLASRGMPIPTVSVPAQAAAADNLSLPKQPGVFGSLQTQQQPAGSTTAPLFSGTVPPPGVLKPVVPPLPALQRPDVAPPLTGFGADSWNAVFTPPFVSSAASHSLSLPDQLLDSTTHMQHTGNNIPRPQPAPLGPGFPMPQDPWMNATFAPSQESQARDFGNIPSMAAPSWSPPPQHVPLGTDSHDAANTAQPFQPPLSSADLSNAFAWARDPTLLQHVHNQPPVVIANGHSDAGHPYYWQ